MGVLGVISDTHVPDRAPRLDPQVLEIFKATEVMAILHAGDISSPQVLEALRSLAPVYAVGGNRDWYLLRGLPGRLDLTFEGIKIGLTHGHGGLRKYLLDRSAYYLEGYRPERYEPRILKEFPEARVIVFGHTHRALNRWVGGQLLFNPGSPHIADVRGQPRSLGLLHLLPGGEVRGELLALTNGSIEAGRYTPGESSGGT